MNWLKTLFKKQKKLLTRTQERAVVAAIKAAEIQSSGEVRLFVESRTELSIPERTIQVFRQLEMHKTRERNAVLVYIALADRKFGIYGDQGIHEKLGFQFWTTEARYLETQLRNGKDLGIAIAETIAHVGERLKVHFPYPTDDRNELPDRPVYGD